MAGLADLFGVFGGGGNASLFGGGGGSAFGGGLDELLTPQMKQQMAQRALTGFLAGMQKSGALDYTAPFISGKVPAGFAAGLAGGVAGMGEARDKGLDAALKALLTGGKLQEMKSNQEAETQFNDLIAKMPPMFGKSTIPGAVPDTIEPPSATAAPSVGGSMRAGGALTGDPLALIEKYESGGRNVMQSVVPPGGGYNPSVGRVTGPSTAQGYYQITNSTWRDTAPKAGVDLEQYPTAMSAPKEVQTQVAQTLFNERGFKPWAPYNPRLAQAINGGEGQAQPSQAAPQAALPAAVAAALPPPGTRLPASAPAPFTPYGGIKPEYIQWAQIYSLFSAKQKKPVPAYISEAAKLPLDYAAPGANPALQGQIAGSRAAGERGVTEPSDMRLKDFQARLDRESERLKQNLAAALDPTTIIAGGRKIPLTRQQFADVLTGRTPIPGTLQPGGALPFAPQQGGAPMLGEPVGVGSTPEGQRLVDTPDGPKLIDIPGGAAARATEERARTLTQSADIVTQDIDRALKLSNEWGTTGTFGSLLQGAPGTPAHNLNQMLQSIKANVGFDRLQQMRNASPSGGGLGSITETENKLLQSTLGALEQSQGKDQFDFNLRRLHNVYQDIVHGSSDKLDAAVKSGKMTPAQRDAVRANRYDLSGAAPKTGDLPRGVPQGAEQIGTYQGKPVYRMPDGSMKVLQ